MITLAIDTSSSTGSIALLKDGHPLAERRLVSLPGHSESLLINMRMMVNEAGIGFSDMDLLGVGLGPGSFTGLRVGLAAMKGLHLSIRRPLLGASSLKALAMNSLMIKREFPFFVCAAIDARRGDIFCAVYEFRNTGIVNIFNERMLKPGELEPMLDKLNAKVLCLGDAFSETPPSRALHISPIPSMIFADEEILNYPSALNIARIAEGRIASGEMDDPAALEPRYLRPVDFTKSAAPNPSSIASSIAE